MSLDAAQPETTAEGLVRLGAAAMVVIFGLTLWNLYGPETPTNWLSNLGVSIGDNSFRTLSLVAGIGLIIGVCLYLRKALWFILAAGIVTLAIVGHSKGWYSLNNQTSANVQMATVGKSTQTRTVTFKDQEYTLINTGVKMTDAHKAWCPLDDNQNGKTEPADNDGIINRNNSALALANCDYGYIHKYQQ